MQFEPDDLYKSREDIIKEFSFLSVGVNKSHEKVL